MIVKDKFIKLDVKIDAIMKLFPKLKTYHEKIFNNISECKMLLHSMMSRKADIDKIMAELKNISEGKG